MRFLAQSTEEGGVYGLAGSGQAFLLSAAIRQGARTVVLVLPDGEAASVSSADVRFYLGSGRTSSHPLLDEVLLYPSSDALPYSFAGFETEVSVGRMAALYRLAEGTSPRLFAVGLDALLRKVIAREAVRQNSFSLSIGQELDRSNLLERLVEAGYSRAPLVEDAGDFSVRGFIIDVYPALYPYPVRIEQMGDQIESIRFFDPSNQRSREELPEVQIGPVQMLLSSEQSRERGIERLVQTCEERAVEKRVRQRLVQDFHHRVRFPGAECYLPYFASPLESLLDYLPRESMLVLPDPDTLVRSLDDVEEEVFRSWESAVSEGLPVPKPDQLYLTRDDLFQRIKKFRTVRMSPLEIEERGRKSIRITCRSNGEIRPNLLRPASYDGGMAALVKRLQGWRDDGNEVFLVSHTRGQADRLLHLLEPYDLNIDFRGEGFEPSNLDSEPVPGLRLYVGELSAGFRMEEARRIVLTEEEIFGSRVRTASRRRARGTLVSSLTDLAEGDPVVHEDYGIGLFRGLAKKEFDGIPGEVMVIEYAGGDLLYHPVERLQVIQKFVSGSEAAPRIDRLGGKGWVKTKAKVKKSIVEMARELLRIYAKRRVALRSRYSPVDENFAAFEAAFEFEETPDQAAAIEDVMVGMDSDSPMDRLVCGDVGYGKTEVALRAAFRAVMDGKQVAILVPTTVLAQQHYDTFVRRLSRYPVNVDVLSRFRTRMEQKEVLERVAQGKVDIVVGTHRLLQKDVAFSDLGLLVVDEEHRFGVAHKEKIKKYKAHVDILT
ncbi:MAG: CarD family transcriptional regulator, partial [Deltaproteobacteria bacterium]